MQLDLGAREITLTLVYYGPAQSGKTTNLRAVHWLSAPRTRGDLMTLGSSNDRTILFDMLALVIPARPPCRLRLKLIAVPGLQAHGTTRRLLLDGADGVVFVADARPSARHDNRESLRSLKENMRLLGRDPADFPTVVQLNKTDLEAIAGERAEGDWGCRQPEITYRATALRGHGVVPTLLGLLRRTAARLEETHGFEELGIDGAGLVAATESNFQTVLEEKAG